MNLQDKVALITGSSKGIGRATAIAFSRKGCRVVVTYASSEADAEETLRLCQGEGHYATRLDLRNDANIRHVVEEAAERMGGIHVLVNNAGIIQRRSFLEQSLEDIRRQIAVNLIGPIGMTQAALPYLMRQVDALILNVAGVGSKKAFPGAPICIASKFGLRGFTQALALELPPHVRTYCVNPGRTSTQMTGYTGASPDQVAEIIVRAAEETLGKRSGDDVDVKEYL